MTDLASVTRSGETEQTYLGDGVYASFDGYQVWLRTVREYTVHEIALEPFVSVKLGEYITRLTTRHDA